MVGLPAKPRSLGVGQFAMRRLAFQFGALFVALTASPISANEQSIELPDNMFIYAMLLDSEVQFTGRPGDYIDVLFVDSPINGGRSTILLTKLLVLRTNVHSGRAGNSRISVSLAVTTRQSLTLSSAEKRGSIRLLPSATRFD